MLFIDWQVQLDKRYQLQRLLSISRHHFSELATYVYYYYYYYYYYLAAMTYNQVHYFRINHLAG